jgi:ABC-type branched-subunit amino acid transport system ATPase component
VFNRFLRVGAVNDAVAQRQRLRAGDAPIVLVEQYYDFAQELADYYVVMERGAVKAQGSGSSMEPDGVRQMVAI